MPGRTVDTITSIFLIWNLDHGQAVIREISSSGNIPCISATHLLRMLAHAPNPSPSPRHRSASSCRPSRSRPSWSCSAPSDRAGPTAERRLARGAVLLFWGYFAARSTGNPLSIVAATLKLRIRGPVVPWRRQAGCSLKISGRRTHVSSQVRRCGFFKETSTLAQKMGSGGSARPTTPSSIGSARISRRLMHR